MALHASVTPCTHPGVVMHLKLMLNLGQDHILYIKDGRSHCDVTHQLVKPCFEVSTYCRISGVAMVVFRARSNYILHYKVKC